MNQRETIDDAAATVPDGFLETLNKVMTEHGTLLRGIYAESARGNRELFDADLPPNGFALPRERSGVIRWIHNPTNADITVTLAVGGDLAPPRFNGVLGPGASLVTYLRFNGGIYCKSGAGAVIGGEFDA